MLARVPIKKYNRGFSNFIYRNPTSNSSQRGSLLYDFLVISVSTSPCLLEPTSFSHFLRHYSSAHQRVFQPEKPFPEFKHSSATISFFSYRSPFVLSRYTCSKWLHDRHISNASIEMKTNEDIVRFSIGNSTVKSGSQINAKKATKKFKMSKRAKVNELKFYRLKAKKKMNSPNPEVRIRYKLEKALEKYRFEQSLEHTSRFIEKLEKELEEYHQHLARYKKEKENKPMSSTIDT